MRKFKKIFLSSLVSLGLVHTVSAQYSADDGAYLSKNSGSGFLQTRQVFIDGAYGSLLGKDKVGFDSYDSYGVTVGGVLPLDGNISIDVTLGYSTTEAEWGYNNESADTYSVSSTMYFSLAPNEQINPFFFAGGSIASVKDEVDGSYYSTSWTQFGVGAGIGMELRVDAISIIPSAQVGKAFASDSEINDDGVSISVGVLAVFRVDENLALRLSAGYGKNTESDSDGVYSIGGGLAFMF